MKTIASIGIAAGLWLAAEGTASAQHVALPPVNLGGTSFVDGVAGPGGLAELTLMGRHAPSTVTSGTALLHLAILFPPKLLGAWWGTEALLPFSHVAVRADDRTMTGTGFGDLAVSPVILQWPAITTASGRPFFYQRAVATLNLPTGRYSPTADVNMGSHAVSVNPYYAFTLFFTDELEASFRLHYLFVSANHDPPARYAAGSIQPGQAVHVNGALSYALMPALRVGVAGYYLKQITDARVGGKDVLDSREQVAAIGPGLRLGLGPLSIRANAFHEFAAENRPEGITFAVTVSNVFPWRSD